MRVICDVSGPDVDDCSKNGKKAAEAMSLSKEGKSAHFSSVKGTGKSGMFEVFDNRACGRLNSSTYPSNFRSGLNQMYISRSLALY